MNTRKNAVSVVRALGILALLLLGGLPLSAQTGVVVVRVVGPAGPVPNARVEILFQEEVFQWGDTDMNGVARLGGVPGGTFQMMVRALGFHDNLVESVRVAPGVSQAVEVALEVAPIELEGLTIRTERVQIERQNTEFSTTVEEAAIRLLPMAYDARDLVALTPGPGLAISGVEQTSRPTAIESMASPQTILGWGVTFSNPASIGSIGSRSGALVLVPNTADSKEAWWM